MISSNISEKKTWTGSQAWDMLMSAGCKGGKHPFSLKLEPPPSHKTLVTMNDNTEM